MPFSAVTEMRLRRNSWDVKLTKHLAAMGFDLDEFDGRTIAALYDSGAGSQEAALRLVGLVPTA